MIPLTQSRTGVNGTCFRTALASILERPEASVPDWAGANEDPAVNDWLGAEYGARYSEIPAQEPPPVGWHLALGLSPRGGQHAVVARNGRIIHDPHPRDGTGRGLVDVERWGVLAPVGKTDDSVTVGRPDKAGVRELEYVAVGDGGKSPAPLRGKRLNAAAEKLYEKHDDIDWNLERQEWMRQGGPPESAYRATHRQVVELVSEAEKLLARAAIDDDRAYWLDKLRKARQAITQSEQKARSGDYGLALSYQEGAFTLAHSVIDKMRRSGARDEAPPYRPGDLVRLPNGRRVAVKTVKPGKSLFGEPEWHVLTVTGDAIVIKARP